eukprot:110151-Pelagomonas_calceolata.AAC.1
MSWVGVTEGKKYRRECVPFNSIVFRTDDGPRLAEIEVRIGSNGFGLGVSYHVLTPNSEEHESSSPLLWEWQIR